MTDQVNVEFARQLTNILDFEAYWLVDPTTHHLRDRARTQKMLEQFLDGCWTVKWLFNANGVPLKK